MHTWLFQRLIIPLFALALLGFRAEGVTGEPLRFVVRMSDGATWQGDSLQGIDRDGVMLTLDGKPLFTVENRARWIRDRERQAGEPTGGYVEFFGGDRLPGEVVGFQAGSGGVEDSAEALVVRPAWDVKPPVGTPVEFVRVARKFVKRIVWLPRVPREYEPNRVFFRDGNSLAFISLRPDDSGYQLLTADGQRHVGFAELAELHLPAGEPWELQLEELAALSPDGSGTLVQLFGSTGIALTTSVERTTNRAIGPPSPHAKWLIGVQPAWSMDVLWLPSDHVSLRRYFTPIELPLSRFAPIIAARRNVFASSRPRVDRNVEVRPLSSGGARFEWGFGVSGPSELRFPLHEFVTGFQTRAGLDARAGEGGCVKARVLAGEPPAVLRETGFLVGSQREPELLQVNIPPQSRSLVLQVDMAHDGRPAGADPLDIRDLFDWLEPVVQLDGERLRSELRHRAMRKFVGAQWQAQFNSAGEFRFTSRFEEPAPQRPAAFRWWGTAIEQPLLLVREIELAPHERFLSLLVRGVKGGPPPPRLAVRANGNLVAEFDPSTRPADTPLLASLRAYRDRKVRLEIEQRPDVDRGPLLWQAIQFREQHPTLRSLFDEDEPFTTGTGQPSATVVDQAHAGEKSLRVVAGTEVRLTWPNPLAIRPNPQQGEFRFLRLAVRKAGLGRIFGELEHTRGAEKTVRFDGGRGEPCRGEAKRAWSLNLPSVWVVMTIDLFADYGALDLTALTLGVPDGEYALFDQVYLGRSPRDLDEVAASESVEDTNRRARTELAKRPLDRGLPATVAIDFGGRWGTGVVLDREHVLTAGHVCVAPNKDATIFFADKSQRAGKTLGVDRQLDVALIRLNEPTDAPTIEFATAGELPDDELYLGVTHQPGYEPGQRPQAYITSLRPPVPDAIGTFFELSSHYSGGPLLDRDGKLLGVHSRRGHTGGFLYTRSELIQPVLDRLRKPEITGMWALGAGPMLGVNVASGPDGCRVIGVIENSPAAKADVRRDDVLEQVDGESVKTLEDLQTRVSDKDPGQKMKTIFRRAQEKREIELELMPRVP